MKKALIHIGSGKTGTSSIQSALFNIPDHQKLPFSYPIIHGNGHQSLEVLFKDYTRISRGLKTQFEKNVKYEKFKEDFACSLNSYTKDALLLSSEFMFSFNLDEIKRLKKYLVDKGFDTFKVVAYLRNPSSYYMSFVQQKIKAAYNIPSPFKYKVKYATTINNWMSVFGDNICIREFDRASMVGGDVLKDFSIVINDFFNGDLLLQGKTDNESISSEGMVVLQEFRKFFFKNQEDRFAKESNLLLKKIQKIELKYPGTKPRLNRTYDNLIIKNSAEDIHYLNKFNIFNDIALTLESRNDDLNNSDCFFSGKVIDLFDDFSEEHYKYILHRLIYDFIR
ncbi:hypothetical protein [Vreelandella titanicae]|uniref:hypothetical protein n=1 Tax=Vreelandella titanicae TaxID=664683 RepID=UPI001143180F|nr:hypothetical protein [Halomonas titanicae]